MAHWLTRQSTIRRLWQVSLALLALLVLAGALVEQHPHFGIDAVFAFPAWYGFGACIVLIVIAKAIGLLLKRPDDYYPPEREPGDD
jgi:hypothetical protein